MPYDSNGVASLAGQRPVNGQDTDAAQINVPLADAQSMFSQVLLKSGVAPMTGVLNMNGFRISNIDDATNDGDAVSKSYLDAETAGIEASVSEAYRRISTRTAAYTALDDDVNTIQRFTSSATLSIAPWADLRTNWSLEVWADGATVTIDPNLAETISGTTTLVVQPGQRVTVFRSTTGTFVAYASGDTFSGAQLQGYSFGLALSRNVTDAANDIDIQSGKAAADTSPFNLMVLASALTKRADASWTVGTNAGGLDTGSIIDGTYYIWLIRRPDTGVVDALFSLSSTAPTLPTSYTQKRLIGSLVRISSVNSEPSLLLRSSNFTSTQQTITLGNEFTVPHGLPNIPTLVSVDLVCVTADLGYSVGDVVQSGAFGYTNSGWFGGFQIRKDITSISVGVPATAIVIRSRTLNNGQTANITLANWRAVVRAIP